MAVAVTCQAFKEKSMRSRSINSLVVTDTATAIFPFPLGNLNIVSVAVALFHTSYCHLTSCATLLFVRDVISVCAKPRCRVTLWPMCTFFNSKTYQFCHMGLQLVPNRARNCRFWSHFHGTFLDNNPRRSHENESNIEHF